MSQLKKVTLDYYSKDYMTWSRTYNHRLGILDVVAAHFFPIPVKKLRRLGHNTHSSDELRAVHSIFFYARTTQIE